MVASVQSLDTPTEAESPHDGDSQDEDGEDDEWQEVGPRNKSVITRRVRHITIQYVHHLLS